MKKELLVPVGSIEHLDYAISSGADAVYLGGKRFGARAYASNFNEEEMIKSIKKCHLYGVKIYVTVNTMIYERERKSALEYVDFLAKNNVDAVIVSDLGLIRDIHNQNPNLNIHVSTQAHTHSLEQIKFLKNLGATRVVLDREMSLEEINKLPNIIEYEVFIHGALCVSYSGECLMSALNEVRSGNRGTCAQYCRMKYRLVKENEYQKDYEYLLSTKELNTSHHIKKLMQSNITSFKIEGRMKSKEYVGFITKFYRNLMNEVEMQKEPFIKEEDEKKLKTIFNREFTNGYLLNEKNIMNFKNNNHQGIPIGKVVDVTRKKIKIKLTENLNQEDGIKFLPSDKGMIVNFLYNEKNALIKEGKTGQIVLLDNKINLKSKDTVHKTIDKLLLEELKRFEEKKIKIQIEIKATNPSFTIIVKDEQQNIVIKKENICEPSKNRSTTKEEIMRQINRLGSTPFEIQKIAIHLEENLFIPVSKINEIRRNAIEKLIEKRES